MLGRVVNDEKGSASPVFLEVDFLELAFRKKFKKENLLEIKPGSIINGKPASKINANGELNVIYFIH